MAIDFAISDYVDVGSGATIDNLWGGGGTIAMWINLDGVVAETHPVIKGDMSAWSEHWAIVCSETGNVTFGTNALGFYLNNGGGDVGFWGTAASTLSTGIWLHIAMTYNGDAAGNDPIFYINGSSSALATDTNPAATPFNDSAYSCRAPYPTVDSKIEDMRWYTTVLTADQIAILASGYRSPLGGEVMWLSMCEARGLASPGVLTQGTHLLPDLSANTNDGDPYGSPSLIASDCPRFGGHVLAAPTGATTQKAIGGPWVGTGTVAKKAKKPLAGPLVLAGAVAKKAKRALAGPLILAGTVAKKTSRALAGTLVLTGVLSKFKLWIFFARFHDYFLTAPQRFAISSNKVQMTARYRDYYLTAPEKK